MTLHKSEKLYRTEGHSVQIIDRKSAQRKSATKKKKETTGYKRDRARKRLADSRDNMLWRGSRKESRAQAAGTPGRWPRVV